MYNKRQFQKYNDKKVLHKVRKQWVTISVALLGALGGGTAVTHVNANAAQTNSNPKQANYQLNVSKLPDHQSALTSDQVNHSYEFHNNPSQSPQMNRGGERSPVLCKAVID